MEYFGACPNTVFKLYCPGPGKSIFPELFDLCSVPILGTLNALISYFQPGDIVFDNPGEYDPGPGLDNLSVFSSLPAEVKVLLC